MITEISDTIQRLALPVALIIAVAITVVVWKLLQAVKTEFEARAGETNSKTFWQAIAFAVQSAEQSGLIAKVKLVGAEKKRLAIDFAEAQLKALGLGVDLDVISNAIETAIRNKWEELQMKPDGAVLVLPPPSSLAATPDTNRLGRG